MRSIQLWDVKSKSHITSLNGHSGVVCGMAFLENQELISVSNDTVRFWQLDDELGRKENFFRATSPDKRGHEYPVASLVYSPDGNFILSAADDCWILRWNSKTGDCGKFLEVGHPTKMMAASSNGQQLAVANGSLRVYPIGASTVPKVDYPDTYAGDVAYSPCGRWMATGDDQGIVILWDLQSGENVISAHQGRRQVGLFSWHFHPMVAILYQCAQAFVFGKQEARTAVTLLRALDPLSLFRPVAE